jgi:hypothetical protein
VQLGVLVDRRDACVADERPGSGRQRRDRGLCHRLIVSERAADACRDALKKHMSSAPRNSQCPSRPAARRAVRVKNNRLCSGAMSGLTRDSWPSRGQAPRSPSRLRLRCSLPEGQPARRSPARIRRSASEHETTDRRLGRQGPWGDTRTPADRGRKGDSPIRAQRTASQEPLFDRTRRRRRSKARSARVTESTDLVAAIRPGGARHPADKSELVVRSRGGSRRNATPERAPLFGAPG